MTLNLSAILLTLFATALAPHWAHASLGQDMPYPSKKALLEDFYAAGFTSVFEFTTTRKNFLIHQITEHPDQGEVSETISEYVKNVGELSRVPSLDFKEGNTFSDAVSHWTSGRVGSRIFEAYKLSDFAICYQTGDSHIADHGFEFCLAVPTSVDFVIARLESKKSR